LPGLDDDASDGNYNSQRWQLPQSAREVYDYD
jgi:hypothetical protein